MPDARGAPDYSWSGALPPDVRRRAEIMQEIEAERRRQIAKGYDAAHDDNHDGGEIILAQRWGAMARLGDAACMITYSTNGRAMLIETAAMIVAEVERIDRAAQRG